MPGLAPPGEQLQAGFAYLIRSSVRMAELYPLLGELLFGTRASRGKALLHGTEGWKSCTNVIGLFVDDDPSNLMSALSVEGESTKEMAQKFVDRRCTGEETGYYLPELAAWMDTYGSFAHRETGLRELLSDVGAQEGPRWLSQSIVSAGNPMSIYRFFRAAGEQKAKGKVNIFLLNSLSNLYRNLGLAETAALLKRMLEDVWLRENNAKGNNGGQVRNQDGLFFAILQEGVMEPAEASYLESFFDGVYRIDPHHLMDIRIPRLRTDSLPLHACLPQDVLFAPKWQVPSLKAKGNEHFEKQQQGCFVTTFLVPPSREPRQHDIP